MAGEKGPPAALGRGLQRAVLGPDPHLLALDLGPQVVDSRKTEEKKEWRYLGALDLGPQVGDSRKAEDQSRFVFGDRFVGI